MPFNTLLFVLIVLPGVVTLYYAKLDRLQPKVFILVASLLAYGIVQSRSLPLLLASIVFNWIAARQLCSQVIKSGRKLWLVAGLIANIGFLCWFKYLDFIFGNIALVT